MSEYNFFESEDGKKLRAEYDKKIAAIEDE